MPPGLIVILVSVGAVAAFTLFNHFERQRLYQLAGALEREETRRRETAKARGGGAEPATRPVDAETQRELCPQPTSRLVHRDGDHDRGAQGAVEPRRRQETPRRRIARAKERTHITRHPEEQSDEGSASTKVLPPLGQIPPLAPLAFGMTW